MISLLIIIVLIGAACILAHTLIPDAATARLVQIMVALMAILGWAGHGAISTWFRR